MKFGTDYFGFVYKWTNAENGKIYIGSHYGDVDDNYIGSGIYFKRAYEQDPLSFRREVIDYIEVDDPLVVLEHEQKALNSIRDLIGTDRCYNLTSNAGGGWQLGAKTPEERQEVYHKISDTLRNKSEDERKVLNQRVKNTLAADPKIKQRAIEKQKQTKRHWSDEDRARMADTMRQTLKDNPDIVRERVQKFKKTMNGRSEADKQDHSDRIKLMWESMTDSERDERIDKQRQTIAARTDDEWTERREKYRETMSNKSAEEIEEAKRKRVATFKNRTPEQKAASEAKRLASRRTNRSKKGKD